MWKVPYLLMMLSMFFVPFMLTHFAFAEQYVPEQYVPDRLLIKFKEGTSAVQQSTALKNNAVNNVLSDIESIGVKIVRVSEGNLDRIQNELLQNPNIEYVEKDFLFEPTIIPNDQKYQYQWHLEKIQVSKAWDIHQGSSSIPIAILDTGVDPNHPDLQGKLILGYNFNNNNNDSSDVCGHGTQVAGIAAASTNNAIGVAGVAWNNPIIPIRITTDTCFGSYSSMIKGIVYAADNGARVANISFRIFDGAILNDAAKYMYDKGGWVVASAGNTGSFENYSDNPYIISVGATYSSDSITSFSSYGPYVDFSAPGSSITTTANGNLYSSGSGTSFSSPIVAGLIALMISNDPSISSAEVYDILKESAVDLGDAGYDFHYGWGRVDAFQALLNQQSALDTEAPSVSITEPLNSAVVSGTVYVNVGASDNEAVNRVELFVDGQLHNQEFWDPYEFNVDTGTMVDGSHELKAIGYDTNGNSAVDQITVIVENKKADTEAPSVSITEPLNSAVVSGTVYVNVGASDNEAVNRVELFVDGQLYDQKISQPYEFNVDTGTMVDGSHELKAIGYDTNGNSAVDQITVIVENKKADTEAPFVSIVTPTDGTALNGRFQIVTSTSDSSGISLVKFYIDNELKRTINNNDDIEEIIEEPPSLERFGYWWHTYGQTLGDHTITVEVSDRNGNVASNTIIVQFS